MKRINRITSSFHFLRKMKRKNQSQNSINNFSILFLRLFFLSFLFFLNHPSPKKLVQKLFRLNFLLSSLPWLALRKSKEKKIREKTFIENLDRKPPAIMNIRNSPEKVSRKVSRKKQGDLGIFLWCSGRVR